MAPAQKQTFFRSSSSGTASTTYSAPLSACSPVLLRLRAAGEWLHSSRRIATGKYMHTELEAYIQVTRSRQPLLGSLCIRLLQRPLLNQPSQVPAGEKLQAMHGMLRAVTQSPVHLAQLYLVYGLVIQACTLRQETLPGNPANAPRQCAGAGVTQHHVHAMRGGNLRNASPQLPSAHNT